MSGVFFSCFYLKKRAAAKYADHVYETVARWCGLHGLVRLKLLWTDAAVVSLHSSHTEPQEVF